MIDLLQVEADHLGHGPGINDVVASEHTPETCKVSNAAIVQRVARSDIISRASAGDHRPPQLFKKFLLTFLKIVLLGLDLDVAYAAVVNPLQISRPDVASTMPAAKKIEVRAKLAKYPDIPHDTNNSVIPTAFAETTAGEPFLTINDSEASVPSIQPHAVPQNSLLNYSTLLHHKQNTRRNLRMTTKASFKKKCKLHDK
jgi:hypothetical protein